MSLNTISNEERYALVKKHSFFLLLSEREIQSLCALMQEEHKVAGDIIVQENDSIDKIYFIAEGEVEVSRFISTIDKKNNVHLAYLKKNDVIGMTKSGLFSTSGLRTAQITAATDTTLLSISLFDLYDLTNSYPEMHENIEKFILISLFSKKKFPFKLEKRNISILIKSMKKIYLKKDNVLYVEKERASKFYILVTGNILTKNASKSAELKSGDFLGEEIFSASPCYLSTATSQTDCKLFEFNSEIFSKLNHVKNPQSSFFEKLINLFKRKG